MLSSLVADYLIRQKFSGTTLSSYIVEQLAVPPPAVFRNTALLVRRLGRCFHGPRVLELIYTSHRIKAYAVDVVGGDPGAPFRWTSSRRAQLMAELDAAMLHLYELDRDDAEHILDSFFVVAQVRRTRLWRVPHQAPRADRVRRHEPSRRDRHPVSKPTRAATLEKAPVTKTQPDDGPYTDSGFRCRYFRP